MIPDGKGREAQFQRRWHYLAVKNYQHYQEEKFLNSTVIFVLIALIPVEKKTDLNRIKKYEKINIFVM